MRVRGLKEGSYMALKIEELLLKIALPKRYFSNEFIFSVKLREEAETFVSLLSQCDGKEFNIDEESKIKHKIPEIYDAAKQNITSLLNIIKCYESADPKTAQKEFGTLMSRIKG
jgi:hypothetical protein